MRAQLDNVLLQRQPDGKLAVKLCDFGYSKELVAWSNCKTRCGTPEYVAPEVNPRPESNSTLRHSCCRIECHANTPAAGGSHSGKLWRAVPRATALWCRRC